MYVCLYLQCKYSNTTESGCDKPPLSPNKGKFAELSAAAGPDSGSCVLSGKHKLPFSLSGHTDRHRNVPYLRLQESGLDLDTTLVCGCKGGGGVAIGFMESLSSRKNPVALLMISQQL